MDSAIQSVSLDWLAARFFDEPMQLIHCEPFGGFGSCIMIDQFMNNGSIEVIRTKL